MRLTLSLSSCRLPVLLSLCLLAALGAAELPGATELPVVARDAIPIANDKPLPAGADIEFYVTADGGRSWRLVPRSAYTQTADGRPSFLFQAPRDGTYGIWIRLTGLQGHSERAPRPGDRPELAFIVDTTAPAFASFTAVIRGSPQGKDLEVSWEAIDQHPGDGPVRIELAPAQGGAWQTLSTGLPLSGTHRARISDQRLRVRLTAVDAAGNSSASPATIPPLVGQVTAPVQEPSTPPIGAGPTTGSSPSGPTTDLPSLAEAEAAVDQQLAASGQSQATVQGEQPTTAVPTVPEASDLDLAERLAGMPVLAATPWPSPSPEAPDEAALIAAATSILKQRSGRILLDRQAAVVLDAARAVAQVGELDQARTWYRRLHDSQLAAVALPEEVLLELRSGHPLRARALAEAAPPDARSPALLLAQAYTWFAEDPSRSLAILRPLPPDTAVAAQADLLRARAHLAADPPDLDAARPLLRRLARLPGPVGAQAQRLLDLLNR